MYSKELIREVHQNLPSELLEAIASENTIESVYSIASENQLTAEQTEKLSSILTWRLMGLIQENNFSTEIETGIKVTPDVATKIRDQILNNVLSPIPTELLKEQEIEGQMRLKEFSKVIPNPEPEAKASQLNKDDVKNELIRRREEVTEGTRVSSNLPEIAPEIHPVKVGFESNLNGAGPMVEKGEIAREATRTEEPAPIQQAAPKPEIERSAPEQIPTGTPIIGANFIPQGAAPAKTPEPPKVESKPITPPPTPPQSPDVPSVEDRRYPGGVDPYREPLN